MGIERERFGSGFVPPWVECEHTSRYLHAAKYARDLVVLDCACGTGFGSRAFLEARPKALIAVDLDYEAVRQTQRRAPGAVTLRGSAASLPLMSRCVDVAISLETIEHLKEDAPYLDEIVRVLRAGGTFVCSTPNRTVTNPGGRITDRPFNRFHQREYSEDEFEALLARRFRSVEMFGQNPCWPGKVSVLTGLGRILGSVVAARIAQAMKLPRLVRDRPSRYEVQKPDARFSYEYLVAVCREPRRTG